MRATCFLSIYQTFLTRIIIEKGGLTFHGLNCHSKKIKFNFIRLQKKKKLFKYLFRSKDLWARKYRQIIGEYQMTAKRGLKHMQWSPKKKAPLQHRWPNVDLPQNQPFPTVTGDEQLQFTEFNQLAIELTYLNYTQSACPHALPVLPFRRIFQYTRVFWS